MNRDIISEKTFCYTNRYVHKKKKKRESLFIFQAHKRHEDSKIIYLDRWNQQSNWALDILADIIYTRTYISNHGLYPSQRTEKIVHDVCKTMNGESFDVNKTINEEEFHIYKINIDDNELRNKYPFIFNKKMTSSKIELFFKSAEIALKTNYKVLTGDHHIIYKMKNFQKIFNLNVKSLSKGSGKLIFKRHYTFTFDNPLGILFIHNIKSLNIHWIPIDLYNCKHPASNFIYKRFFKCKNVYERKNGKTISFDDICNYLNYNKEYSSTKNIINTILKDLENLIPQQNNKNYKLFYNF